MRHRYKAEVDSTLLKSKIKNAEICDGSECCLFKKNVKHNLKQREAKCNKAVLFNLETGEISPIGDKKSIDSDSIKRLKSRFYTILKCTRDRCLKELEMFAAMQAAALSNEDDDDDGDPEGGFVRDVDDIKFPTIKTYFRCEICEMLPYESEIDNWYNTVYKMKAQNLVNAHPMTIATAAIKVKPFPDKNVKVEEIANHMIYKLCIYNDMKNVRLLDIFSDVKSFDSVNSVTTYVSNFLDDRNKMPCSALLLSSWWVDMTQTNDNINCVDKMNTYCSNIIKNHPNN
jgi:hypothetical protein